MKKAIIECVINISEGREELKLTRIVDIFQTAENVTLVHQDIGYDANRTVFTLLGEVEAIFFVLEQLINYAQTAFDIRKHEGTHPRIGILDVIPFIPIKGITKETLEKRVKSFFEHVGTNHNLPILYYGSLSKRDNQKNLNQLRRKKIDQTLGHSLLADCGPQVPHLSLGASCVTVRDFMLAFNINLNTQTLEAPKKLARHLIDLRSTQEGPLDLTQVKFLAWYVDEYKCCQISTNIYDIGAVTMKELYELVQEEARQFNLEICGSELIGMTLWRGITRDISNKEYALSILRLDSVRPFQEETQVLDYFIDLI